SAAFDAPDGAVRVDRGNDVFTNLLAFSTIRVHIAPDLRAFAYTKRIFHHYFDPVSILSNLFTNNRGFTMRPHRRQPDANKGTMTYSNFIFIHSFCMIRLRISDALFPSLCSLLTRRPSLRQSCQAAP